MCPLLLPQQKQELEVWGKSPAEEIAFGWYSVQCTFPSYRHRNSLWSMKYLVALVLIFQMLPGLQFPKLELASKGSDFLDLLRHGYFRTSLWMLSGTSPHYQIRSKDGNVSMLWTVQNHLIPKQERSPDTPSSSYANIEHRGHYAPKIQWIYASTSFTKEISGVFLFLIDGLDRNGARGRSLIAQANDTKTQSDPSVGMESLMNLPLIFKQCSKPIAITLKTSQSFFRDCGLK